MRNPIAALNAIRIGKPNNVLVLHHDGFVVKGAAVHGGIAGEAITAAGRSRATDYAVAVSEVLEQTKAAGWRRLPKKAVLVTDAAVASLVTLPVDPQRPRVPAQMKELVRWELEPLFAQSGERWGLGAMLMGRGYLDADARSQIMREVRSRNAASSQRVNARFGEMAQSLGYVNREQMDECLALQEKLVQLDDDLVCGWWPQRRALDDDGDALDASRHPWLVGGIGEGLRRHWVRACERNGLFLETIYPALGAGFARMGRGGERDIMYVDVHQEQFVVMRGRPGMLAAYRSEAIADGRASPEQIAGLCHEELRPDIESIRLNARHGVFDAIAGSLAEVSGRPVLAASEGRGGEARAA